MTDLLSASVSLGVKNKREISWKKISQPQTPLCRRLSRNLPSPVVWDLDWILHCADLPAHLPVPEHPYAGHRDREAPTMLTRCERLGLPEGLLYTAPAACTHQAALIPAAWVCTDLTLLVRDTRLPAKGHEARVGQTACAAWEPWQHCHEGTCIHC